MATFKADVKTKRSDGTYPVYIRVTHNRKIAFIRTDMYVHDRSYKNGEIIDQMVLAQCGIKIKGYLDKLNAKEIERWTVKEVVEFITLEKETISFTTFCEGFIQGLRNQGRERTADGYRDALTSFRKFFGEDIAFQDLTSAKIKKWIESLKDSARAKQKYPTNIKSMFMAGDEEYNDYDSGRIRFSNRPFHGIKIPKADIPPKRSVDVDKLRVLFSTTPDTKRSVFAKDVAKIMIYLVGINAVDLYYMEKMHLKEGKLCYFRHKTTSTREDKAYYEISIKPEIIDLFEKYKGKEESDYLFDFKERYSDEQDFVKAINKGLKRLCEIANIEKMTTYTLRHTWATVAHRKCKASDELIGFCLNHASAHRTSRIYIDVDFSPIDELNNQVLDAIFSPKEERQEEIGGAKTGGSEIIMKKAKKVA
ncbi:phage integrase SAM-like domain-containing protein [Dysgonomonas sp. 25]|uniref:tyrosine-type recombinase/integrase n=1 Tax=Dysgonomonas sp. 25 TaxID=2302933 RepID=UPI0013D39E2C|nr:phage integrase SAM-like domain-containing protein [Dysgonomonas sp. 25]NDV68641.1 transposase [Dysgonomonas sp. 25]